MQKPQIKHIGGAGVDYNWSLEQLYEYRDEARAELDWYERYLRNLDNRIWEVEHEREQGEAKEE